MWDIIVIKALENEIKAPDIVVLHLDFETASANSFQQFFPCGSILRCYVHFWRAIQRKLKKLGLWKRYSSDGGFNKTVRKLIGLAFVAPTMVRSSEYHFIGYKHLFALPIIYVC